MLDCCEPTYPNPNACYMPRFSLVAIPSIGSIFTKIRRPPNYRTRAASRGSTFNDQSFLATKPADGLRLFCLGGSSSFGFPWGAEAAFTSIVGEALAATHPQRHVEAVNASGVSYAMHPLNIVADELL